MRVSITPSNPIPANGKIGITTLQWWPSDTQNISLRGIFNTSGISCTNVTNTVDTMTCGITLQPSSPYSIFYINISSLFSAVTSSNFAFSVNPFLTPPTTKVQGAFNIYSMTNSGAAIDQCTGITISGITAASITTLSFSMNTNTVNSAGSATFRFTIINVLTSTDTIKLTFPNDFTLGTISATYSGNPVTTSKSSNVVSVTGMGGSSGVAAGT